MALLRTVSIGEKYAENGKRISVFYKTFIFSTIQYCGFARFLRKNTL